MNEENAYKWKILIVDDEKEVHNVTSMVLSSYSFDNKGLFLYHAYSSAEAKRILQEKRDIAIVLLDVVMEYETAGLDLAKWIREELKNKFLRIILRTGQPGTAPERRVIRDYDINDYKEKTELTAQKLFTAVTASIRAYRDLRLIERNRLGLEQIVAASSNLFELKSLKLFASGVLSQLTSLLHLEEDSMYVQASGLALVEQDHDFMVLAGSGSFANALSVNARQELHPDIQFLFTKALKDKQSFFYNDYYTGYFQTKNNSENVLILKGGKDFNETEKSLIQIFSSNVAVAFDNIYLNQEIEATQREVVLTLGEVVENRSKETGNHVKRVGAVSELLGELFGLSNKECELLRLAAPMHDVGKIGVSDIILNKPASLEEEEFEEMKKHTSLGFEILKGSDREVLTSAALIALQHHEQWNGLGYPHGLAGTEIHIYGRIVAIADVFDALSHKRIYKVAWERDKIQEFFQLEKGKRFDPALIEVFIEHFDDFWKINTVFPGD